MTIAIISEISEDDEIRNKEEAPKKCEIQKLEEIQNKEVAPEKCEIQKLEEIQNTAVPEKFESEGD